ncbi:PKD-like domain-containing protein [Desertivirga xinjiangensis]|uniref:PKD-like domain-containing protein n=1 Tax=Desertivirga xinjiangensis TaxID=539206 RepID=UPI00210C6A53|nr:PKD-like domain-containing protein [Pedobacter xinjiangensis]
MMNIKYHYLLLITALSLFSCGKENETAELPPQVSLSLETDQLTLSPGEIFKITASVSDSQYKSEWLLNNELVSTANEYNFTAGDEGVYSLKYKAINDAGEFSKTYTITVVFSPGRPVSPESNAYVTSLVVYKPAPGQFINKAPGNLESANSIVGKKGTVSLGAYGGYIVLGFDHTVLDVADKEDIIVYGNGSSSSAEPGIVYVMRDDNKNGLADDTWYELSGSAYNSPGYERNYSVTYTRPNPATADIPWRDSKGNTGVVKTNNFHKQAYYPEWIAENEYTLTGSLLPSSNIDMSNPNFIKSAPFEFGYADNIAGSDKLDIKNAINAEGKTVKLYGIDFIKIQTGIQASLGWLGELSTEVTGVADLSLVK